MTPVYKISEVKYDMNCNYILSTLNCDIIECNIVYNRCILLNVHNIKFINYVLEITAYFKGLYLCRVTIYFDNSPPHSIVMFSSEYDTSSIVHSFHKILKQ